MLWTLSSGAVLQWSCFVAKRGGGFRYMASPRLDHQYSLHAYCYHSHTRWKRHAALSVIILSLSRRKPPGMNEQTCVPTSPPNPHPTTTPRSRQSNFIQKHLLLPIFPSIRGGRRAILTFRERTIKMFFLLCHHVEGDFRDECRSVHFFFCFWWWDSVGTLKCHSILKGNN